MKIERTEIYKFSIPMHPFSIATGTMHFAQNIFIRIHTSEGLKGLGECSAFPMIAGETQNTCYEMAKDFAGLWKGKPANEIENRMQELHAFAAYNATIKSAFDMALYDLAAKKEGVPLYKFLGGEQKEIETDLTIGLGEPSIMAEQALDFIQKGVRIIKIKLGKNAEDDVERVKQIADAVPEDIVLRLDANQGWSFEDALFALNEVSKFNIEFCEQPMRKWNDHRLPELRKMTSVPIMADESVFDHHDAERLIREDGCAFVNIKLAKSGGMLEAREINRVCEQHRVPCMMGGMLESRFALTAFGHFALAHPNVQFYDMDTCMLGHKSDPVTGGLKYRGFMIQIPDEPGIGADIDQSFLDKCESIVI